MELKDIVLGEEYVVIDSGLHALDIGDTVRAVDFIESIVTNDYKYVLVLFDEDLYQTLEPKVLKPKEVITNGKSTD